ncbi:cytidine deaminase [Propionigenium maris DSM 9537]|jgi:cytidine deaminase|uniref:Cytidine deaminase n=1 Tax=Propionigenium maris DSM 9537 TaxID=1123000 RepID=A0A9W6LM96_9FUSO|nr:cytidine deaminase [Propionigenium maris]GLI55549.1 cytidine deaminase [Propionigenium maris DSM 9537]
MRIEEREIFTLIDEAIEARENAYTKYSGFKVGAVVVDENGNHHLGANVENASYGLSNCGERTAIFTGVTKGMKRIDKICIVADTSGPVSPCGACRQVIKEFSTDDTIIILANLKKDYKILTMEELLPYGFEL